MTKRAAKKTAKAKITTQGQNASLTSARELPAIPLARPKFPKNKATVLKSKLAYKGPVFSVYTDQVREPNGVEATRDIVRHNGSVVILAVDETTNPADPLIVIERQFRYAAGQYLLELPAGRVEPGENTLAAAKRELIEETGYRAKKWTKLVRYYASPGFVGEWMEIFLATGIVVGKAEPEDDERIEVRLLPLSQMEKMAAAGEIHDGKTIVGTMIYAQRRRDTMSAA